MNDKMKILLPVSCRSDDPLTRPMIDALKAEHYYTIQLEPGNFRKSYKITEEELENRQYDCILIMGDRIEMFAAAVAAFYNHVPIIFYGAGITNTIATFDDIARHQICLLADICLVEDMWARETVIRLWNVILKPMTPNNVHIVGNLYLEDLTVDESLVPSEPYELYLINRETINEGDYILQGTSFLKNIIIGSNPDAEFKWQNLGKKDVYYDNLPRNQFLGLLKNCQRFITNSSSAYYEAMPLGLKREQIILIGERNKNRSTPRTWNQDYKTSEKIVQIIKKWWEDK